jgi:putative flavoprotein involved in K+ transport
MVIVVGAGPTGLATAYHLQQHGFDYCVLEKGCIGYSWQNHYDGLHLHTLKEVSALPGLPMPADYPRFPSAEQVSAYLRSYAHRLKLRVREGVEVRRADYGPDGWRLDTSQGPMQCDTLVVATGIWSTPVVPRFAGQETFGGCVLHASHYRNPQPFAGQRVLVVGAGNTGTEIAVQLSEHAAHTGIVIRDGSSFAPYPSSAAAVRLMAWLFRHTPHAIGRPLLASARRSFDDIGIRTHPDAPLRYYPVVGYELPDAVRAGRVMVYGGIERFVPGGVRFEDGQEVAFDSVVLATGYRPTLDFVRHELEFDQRGRPVLHNGRSTRNPHLFCVGFDYPTTEGFLQSLGRVTLGVVRELRAAA